MATTADYLNKLVEQKNALADNLVTKGVTATHDETLETLVPKVLNINGGSSTSPIDGDLSYSNYQNQVSYTSQYIIPYIALALVVNALYTDVYRDYGGCGYNFASDVEKDRLAITKTNGGYNITHTQAIDFSTLSKIIIYGAIRSNIGELTSTAYYYINSEKSNEINENWNVLNSTMITSLISFTKEIDCSQISGNNYLHLAINHGTEVSGYTSFFYIDRIEFL